MTETGAIFHSPSPEAMSARVQKRTRLRLAKLSEPQIADLLADTVFHERKRLEKVDAPAYSGLIDQAARTLRDLRRTEMEAACLGLVDHYIHEIHNPFSPRTYRFATRVLPVALTRLLSASRARELLDPAADPQRRIRIDGPLDHLQALMKRGATLILAPTHVSNLDSPLIGYALYAAGLPPFAYGAGLNLFSNPVMAFFMERLGTYTVDRTKRSLLYKDVLKDYSVELLKNRTHSLFFPGGTRSRSGRLERKLKKGLLGTGLAAWQENLAEGKRDGDVFVVPLTLSISVVLEAETLIADALAEEGKQRYIIMDDEFSEARVVASFARRLLELDAPVHVVFGQPLDVTGNPVDREGVSHDPKGRPIDRVGYVTDKDGRVVFDEQRDHVYTERLAEKLSEAYHRDLVLQSTHLASWAAWEALREAWPGLDTWRLVRLHPDALRVSRARVEALTGSVMRQLAHLRRASPDQPVAVVEEAIQRFARFHKKRAIAADGAELRLSPELVLYYRNRLDGYQLRREAP